MSKKPSQATQLDIFGGESPYQNLVKPIQFYVRVVRGIDGGRVSASRGKGPYENIRDAIQACNDAITNAESFLAFVVESPLGKWEDRLHYSIWARSRLLQDR